MNYNDISIEDSTRGGELEFYRNDFVLTAGLRNNVYLSLFGGNVEESSDKTFNEGQERFDWWGNQLFFEGNLDKQFNSTTEKALREVSVSSSGRAIIQRAIEKDLKALNGIAEIDAQVFLDGLDRIRILIFVTEKENGITTELEYLWDAAREEENEREFRAADPTPPDPDADINVWVDGLGNPFVDGNGLKFTW